MKKIRKTVTLVALSGVAIAFVAAPSLSQTFARETESRLSRNHHPDTMSDLAQAPMDPDQTPMGPGQAPMDPDQTPMGPGQAPMGPGQTPMGPGQMPMGPGQMPYQGMPMSGQMLGLMCETQQIMSTLTPEQMQEVQPIMLEHHQRMVDDMQTTLEQVRQITNQPEDTGDGS